MQAWDKLFEIKHAQPEDTQELLIKLVEDVRSINEEFAEFINIPTGNLSPSSYDDDDDEESSIPLKDIIMSELPPCVAITPALYTDEPVDSLIIEDEHLDTIPETESDEFIKSSVENLVQDPSESEGEYSRDDSLAPIKIPPGIDIINLDPEGDILFLETLLYDNSSPRPPEAFQANSDTIIDSSSTIPIPVEDSDSSREEIDIFFGPEDSIPPVFEVYDFDSED
ncbi:hypothetical protein Tco_0483375 [Tanacetum coccineum]